MDKKTLTAIIGVIVIFITVFSILSATSDSVKVAASSASVPNNCSSMTNSTYNYNATDGKCYDRTGASYSFSAATYALPLAGLFASSGVVLLIVFAAILLIVIKMAMRK